MNYLMDNVRATEDGDQEGFIRAYGAIDRLLQLDVPLVSLYVISPLGVVSNKLKNANPSPYGFLLNVHEWELN